MKVPATATDIDTFAAVRAAKDRAQSIFTTHGKPLNPCLKYSIFSEISACHDWEAERNLHVQIFHVEELLFI